MVKHAKPEKIEQQLSATITGKNVVITGATSGIGKETAKLFAKAGANVIVVARNPDKLAATKAELSAHGSIDTYSCDLSKLDTIEDTAKQILKNHGHIDVLVNNAGRSIRRPIKDSLNRFHDYERTMQLNYFGAVKLIHAVLPSMMERRKGHVINISSYGVLLSSAFFSAYVASKAALDAYSRCLAAEVKHKNISVTTLNFPLVRTPMISPTKLYDYIPAITPYEAAISIAHSAIHRVPYDSTRMSKLAAVATFLTPELSTNLQAFTYRYSPRFDGERNEEDTSRLVRIGQKAIHHGLSLASKFNPRTKKG